MLVYLRTMPRRPRKDLPEVGVYHVTSRGTNHCAIDVDDVDRKDVPDPPGLRRRSPRMDLSRVLLADQSLPPDRRGRAAGSF